MAQVAISTGGPQLRGLLPLVEFDSLIFHEPRVLKLTKIDVLKIFDKVSHLNLIFFDFAYIYDLVHL